MIDRTSTSIPRWADAPGGPVTAPPPGGTAYVVVGVGSGRAVAHQWAAVVANPTVLGVDDPADVDPVERELAAVLSSARVGTRVALAGPVGACLRLRAVAVRAGAEDDEVHVHATEAGAVEVFCPHCSASSGTTVGVDGVVACMGCGRQLVVYHHVSRRRGQFLGYDVEAETPAAGSDAEPDADARRSA